MSSNTPVTLIPGDGIGPEIVSAPLAVVDELEVSFDWDVQQAGLAGVKATGDPLPEAVLDSIRRTRLALKGPLETPSGKGYRSSNVRLREAFKLYANVRPARTLIPGGRYDNIDLLIYRENLEGLRSEEHTSELQSLMRISYAVFCLKKKKNKTTKPKQ